MKSHQADNETNEKQGSAVQQRPPVSWGQHLETCDNCSTLWGMAKQGLLVYQNTHAKMSHHALTYFTFWDAKSRHDSLNQTQNIESTAAHIGKEKHDPNAATKLWTKGSADHIWGSKLRDSLWKKLWFDQIC